MQKFFKAFNDFIEEHKASIYLAFGLVIFANLLIATPFVYNFMHTSECRDFLMFGSPYKTCTFYQLANYGIKWLSFTDTFIFTPAIIFTMLVPRMIEDIESQQKEAE